MNTFLWLGEMTPHSRRRTTESYQGAHGNSRSTIIFVAYANLFRTPRTVPGTGQTLEYVLNEWCEWPGVVSSRAPGCKLKPLHLQPRAFVEPWQWWGRGGDFQSQTLRPRIKTNTHRPPQPQPTGERGPGPQTRSRQVILIVSGLVKDLWALRKKRRQRNPSEKKKKGSTLQTGQHSCLFPSASSVTLLATQVPHVPHARKVTPPPTPTQSTSLYV